MLSGTDRVGRAGEGFSNELSRLKRQGTSVLVVGSVQPARHRDASQRLLSRGSDRVRRRVLVSTTSGPHHISRFVGDVDSDTLSVISYDPADPPVAARGAVSSRPSETGPTDVDTLTDLGIAIANAIDAFEADANGLEPAEVRVSIDSLVPLLEAYGNQRVFKFLHLINGRTQHVGGMAQYHLPVDRDDRIVPTLSPLFDVVVELRERNGDAQERWVIDDGTYSSGWLPVDRA
ncbi:hypothetical protein NDI89_17830 [Natrinema sp. S1CR25-10]|uniref:Uncharacterized protein n=1 Tax=Natrinema salsiterrestre TaxID=2950540 RepID=A0A9Q4L5U6_9EURY|nr:hypothetical protein [Natrinema salsiterrestre]